MNLNFYQPDGSNNSYLESLRNALNDQMNKLDQLKNISLGQNNIPAKVNQPLQPQRYYLDCGLKEDWDEFLKVNYGITEKLIFEDYRLFLQAKAELHQDTDKERLEAMKNKLRPANKGTTINASDSSINNDQPIIRDGEQSMEQYNQGI